MHQNRLPIALVSTLQVREFSGSTDVIDIVASEWRELANRVQAQPFLLPEWIGIYLSTFEPNARVTLYTVERAGVLVGVLPLIREKTEMYGIPVGRLRAPVAPKCPDRFDILCASDDSEEVAAALWAHIRTRSYWDVIELVDLPEGGPGWRMMQLAEESGQRTGRRLSRRTPFIPLPDHACDLAEIAPATSAKFRANLRRRRARLSDLGPVEVKRLSEMDDAMLQRFLELENSGWKGSKRTSILSITRMTNYYKALVAAAAANGYLAIYSLEAGGETIAMHLGVAMFGRYFVPKLSFDESRHEFGPGHLLVSEVINDCVARGYTEFDFLGDESAWKREWTDQFHIHYRVHIFSNSLSGRLAYRSRYTVIPRVKRLLDRLPRYHIPAPQIRTAGVPR